MGEYAISVNDTNSTLKSSACELQF